MASFHTYRCDECGKLRSSDTNRWFVARFNSCCVTVYKWDEGLASMKADSEFEQSHLCGEACVQKFFAGWTAQR